MDFIGIGPLDNTIVLKTQLVGSAIITLSTFAVALVVMLLVNSMGLLRISPEGDQQHSLDRHEHGISSYPEYVIASIGRPGGMAPEPLL